MYTWVWRKLPGGLPGKLVGVLLLFVAVVAVLFLVVFPWASPKLPFNHVTIDTPTSTVPATPNPSARPTDTSTPATPT